MDLVDLMYEITNEFPKSEMYGLISQSRRSAISIPSNIAEGSQRSTVKEFAQFILIAKGSLAELQTQMYIAQRRKFFKQEHLPKLFDLIDEISRMLYSFHKKLITVH